MSSHQKGLWFVTLLMCFVLSATGAHANQLKPFKLKLEAHRYSPVKISLKGEQYFQPLENNQWKYGLSTRKGWIKYAEHSVMRWQDGSYLPISFDSKSRMAFFKETKAIRYNYPKNKIHLEVNGDKRNYDLKPSLFDPLSYQILMALGMTQGDTQFRYDVFRYKRPASYSFKVVKKEKLKTKMGLLNTVVIEQFDGTDDNERKIFWLAEDYQFVPIRFEHHEKNKLVSLITAVSGTVGSQTIRGK